MCVLVNQNIDAQLCEKTLAPHELRYLGLFDFALSNFFHVIVNFKSSAKKCWNFHSFFWNSNCK